MIREYDVTQPPNLAQLQRLLRERTLGVAVLPIVVFERLTELDVRRGVAPEPRDINFTITEVSYGPTPFILGYVDDESRSGRLGVKPDQQAHDDERELELTVFEPIE